MSAIPQCFTQGDDVRFTVRLPSYPGGTGGYELALHFVNQEHNQKAVGDWNGTAFAFHITAAQTRDMPVGEYKLFGFVSNIANGERKTIMERTVEVRPDPADSTQDFRTANEVTLAAIDAMLARKATTDQKQITVDGQTLIRYSFDELFKMRDRYRKMVHNEQLRAAGVRRKPRTIKARMR